MKKKSLKLQDLKVKSFITAFETEQGKTVKGGTNVAFDIRTVGDKPVITIDTCANCPTITPCPTTTCTRPAPHGCLG